MKKLLLVFSIISVVTTTVFSQIPTDGLVVYYPFNGDNIDASGNGNNATISGAVFTSDELGLIGAGLDFEESEVKDHATTPKLNLGSEMSFNVWVMHETLVDYGTILGASDIKYKLSILSYLDGKFHGVIAAGPYWCDNYLESSKGLLKEGVWQMITLTYDNTNVRVYLNGEIQVTFTCPGFSLNNPLIIGNRYDLHPAYGFDGIIDEFRAYDRQLSDIEIQNLYLAIETQSTNETGSIVDIRDNREYRTVKIGEQWWMSENLAYLPMVSNPSVESQTSPHYYVYDYMGTNVSEAKATDNYNTYGSLYNWTAAQDACPTGWHLPSENELQELEAALGMSQSTIQIEEWRGTNEGGKLKEIGTEHWKSPNSGATNETGFNALPSGYVIHGEYQTMSEFVGYWSSTTGIYNNAAYYRALSYDRADIRKANYKVKNAGYSVRCITENQENLIKSESLYPIGKYTLDPYGLGGLILGSRICGGFNVADAAINEVLDELWLEVGKSAFEFTVDQLSEDLEIDGYPNYITLCMKVSNDPNRTVDISDFVFLMEVENEIPIGYPINVTYRNTTLTDGFESTPSDIGTILHWESINQSDNYYDVYSLGNWLRRGLLDNEMIDLTTIGVVNGYTYQAGDIFMILRSFGSYTAGSYIKMHFIPIIASNMDYLPSIGSLIEIQGTTKKLAIGDGTIRQKYSTFSSIEWVNTYIKPESIKLLNGNYTDQIYYGTSLINVYEFDDGNALTLNFVDEINNAPDFEIKKNSIIQYPEEFLEENKKYTLTATILNKGQIPGSCEVEFYYTSDNQCISIGASQIINLIPGQEKICSIDWSINELYPDKYGVITTFVQVKKAAPVEINSENNIAFQPINVNNSGLTDFINGFLDIFAQCPVYLEVTDPHNNVTNFLMNDIPEAEYSILDLDDNGTLDHRVFITNPDSGKYTISVIPLESANPNDTFSLSIRDENLERKIVNNDYISNIPTVPYEHYEISTTSIQRQFAIDSEFLYVFPNPFYNITNIKFENHKHFAFSLNVKDLSGRTVHQVDGITSSEYKLNLGGFVKGVYFLELKGDKVYKGKVLIQ